MVSGLFLLFLHFDCEIQTFAAALTPADGQIHCLMKIFLRYVALFALTGVLFSLASCGEDKFEVEGMLDGADAAGRSIVLEKSDFQGRWVAVDSTRSDDMGHFSISRIAPAAPEIFRIALDGKYIYFPVDSTETLTVKASARDFDSSFEISGSEQAKALADFEKSLISLPANASEPQLEDFRRSTFTSYISPWMGRVLSYYVLTKVRGDKPIFDATRPGDAKYFAAVATGYQQHSPSDPRTPLLEQTARNAMKSRNAAKGVRQVIEADETQIIDISLPDEEGKVTQLSSVTGKGVPTVLMFSLMNHPDSPEVNRRMAALFRRGGLQIYHVSLDSDQFEWREGARNLPWTTVYDAAGNASTVLASYNVSSLPTFFIYDRTGNLSARAESISDLEKKLAAY